MNKRNCWDNFSWLLWRCWFILDTLMSGSPIIQNGKLVGAVTHVLINNPASGYGIFLENMPVNMPLLAR